MVNFYIFAMRKNNTHKNEKAQSSKSRFREPYISQPFEESFESELYTVKFKRNMFYIF